VVGARLRRLVTIIEELSFSTVRQRLIALLVRLAETTGQRSRDGLQFDLTKSHQNIAAELGTVRELVSRNLSRLQDEGLLEVQGRKIVVKDLAALEQARNSET
jgi:CRP/FNR family transcriptional regulator